MMARKNNAKLTPLVSLVSVNAVMSRPLEDFKRIESLSANDVEWEVAA